MFDAHIHPGTNLVPAEAAALARQAGYRRIALLCRCDQTSLRRLFPPLFRACGALALYGEGEVLPGVELVHLPPPLLAETVAEARALGAALVAVHGEFPGGCVPLGTNLAALEAGADLLLHPGNLTDAEAALAAARGVHLELSLCSRHALFNGHIARLAERHQAPLLTGSNAGRPEEIVALPDRRAILHGAGLDETAINRLDAVGLGFITKKLKEKRR
ncbi:MAG: histidinol phosphate phosphatase domain-containing protein [Deltaproteobacteria bacterium]|jgi:histidinol phosphatase-like PHP family hydrolase|nr:histidinol phosphate phosphatase domain-containing protein [Deltaproteobacteria bacterium]